MSISIASQIELAETSACKAVTTNEIGTLPLSPPVVPFSPVYLTGDEAMYVQEAIASGQLCGDGPFTKRCQAWLKDSLGAQKVLLTHSCTAALEMAVILADIGPGDEVILPSFTFVSTANPVVLRGGVPVFVDVRPDTFCLDETLVEAAITERTKAIIPVHYAGVGAEMQTLREIADRHGLLLIEDAAQGLHSTYHGKPLGIWGHLAAFSFHGTKNVVSGEGGALVINDPKLLERAEVIWEKGTNRSQFFRGEVDKYTWVDQGSSYLPGELIAAFLWAQLQQTAAITQRRLAIWDTYHQAFEPLETRGFVQRAHWPQHCQHNAHIYGLLFENLEVRTQVLASLKQQGVMATFHYVPLHSSPGGQRYGRVSGSMAVTDSISDRLVRLPLSAALTPEQVQQVIRAVYRAIEQLEWLGFEGDRN
jgi:dTDP-4-amino-4,6-dideoxygalactose transaminase